MHDLSGLKKLNEEELGRISGGATRAYLAAVDVMNGKYGSDEECKKAMEELGLDYWSVLHMANALAQGYGQVAQDVIDLKYGKDAARFKALAKAGYDPVLVQQIVNGMLRND